MSNNTDIPMTEQERIQKLELELAKTQAELVNAHAELSDAHAEIDGLHADVEHFASLDITFAKIADALEHAEDLRKVVYAWIVGQQLSDADRRRLVGSGVRRYGFIDKMSDLMTVHTEFVPSFLDVEKFKKRMRMLEEVRNINSLIAQITRANGDVLLLLGDEAFREAMIFYGSVRDASLRRVQGARELFRIMQQFYRRQKSHGDEPTESEVERDVRALLHNKKEGEIIIRNEKAHSEGGEHLVIDHTHSHHDALQHSKEGETN